MNAFMYATIYIYSWTNSISHKGRSRFTRDWSSTRFLPVILSSRRQISGLRMYQKGRTSENILLFSSTISRSDRRYSARINKDRNVGSILQFEHCVCEPMNTVPCTDMYTIYKSSCSILFCEKGSAIRHKGVLFVCVTRNYHSGVFEYANILLHEAVSVGSASNTFFRDSEMFTT